MKQGMFELDVAVNGKPVREYSHSDGRVYVEAKGGTQYTLRVKNNGWKRIMVVLSVDGIDVLEGKPAEECKRGYIINGYSSETIKGYRVDKDNVAAFKFFRKKDGGTYAKAVTGTTQNCGVIGIRVFEEKVIPQPSPIVVHEHHHWPQYPYKNPWDPVITWGSAKWTDDGLIRSLGSGAVGQTLGNIGDQVTSYNCSLNDSAPANADVLRSFTVSTGDVVQSSVESPRGGGTSMRSMSKGLDVSAKGKASDRIGAAPNFDTGTGWGEKVNDTVSFVNFEVGNVVAEFGIYYASRKSLEEIGIEFDNKPKIAEGMPKAFGGGFCKPPTGWQG
jgi:hypothetical protein